jgi:alpha-L-fucosidase
MEAYHMSLARPSKAHLEWADCEIGVIIHHDLEVYDEAYLHLEPDNLPGPEVFHPSALDTDQWLSAAASAGAQYAVLVAKHCSGFSLWPTRAHAFSVASSPWRNGTGDVVADFIRSCRKFNIRPGLYASCGNNDFFRIRDNKTEPGAAPGHWERYVQVVKTQLTELFTNYGDLFEIWFDGGSLPYDRGGAEICELINRHQPDALVFNGNPQYQNSIRWIGNEHAIAPDPCFSATDAGTTEDGTRLVDAAFLFAGNRHGRYWCPGEADMPNRDKITGFLGGWFWRRNQDHTLYRPVDLVERYYSSVGRNCNHLIGMVIDNRGLVPDADVRQFADYGRLIRRQYENCRGKIRGKPGEREFVLDVADAAPVNMFSLMEEISKGETVCRFQITGFDGEREVPLVDDKVIGHKRLIRLPEAAYPRYRLKLHEVIDEPHLREFAAYYVAP